MLFNSDIMNFMWNTDEGEAEGIVFLIFVFLVMLLVSVGEGWWNGEKSYLGPAEKAPFSSQNFSRSNKHDTFGHVVFDWIFLHFIFMNHCCLRFSPLGNL